MTSGEPRHLVRFAASSGALAMKREDFDGWLRDPVTRWIMAGVRNAAEQDKAEWVRDSWESGNASPERLLELRTRASALTELVDNEFETWQVWNGEEPLEQTD